MNSLRLFSGLLLIAAIAPLASAEVPKKAAPGRYSRLTGASSPFTTLKPIEKPDIPNLFADYALSAVSPVTGGYFVILQNKKKPDERVTLQPGSTNELGFTVKEVRPGSTGLLSTTVMLSDGRNTGLVAFDEKLLVLKPTAPPNKGHNGGGPQPGQPGFNPNQQPGNNNPVVMNGGVPIQNPNPAVNPTPVPNPNPTGRGPGSGNNFNPGGRNNGGNNGTQGGGGGGNRPPRPRVVSPNR